MGSYPSILEFVETEFQRLVTSSSSRFITHRELFNTVLPEGCNLNFNHIPTLFVLDYDKDGVFSLQDLQLFAGFVSEVSAKEAELLQIDVGQLIQAMCLLRMRSIIDIHESTTLENWTRSSNDPSSFSGAVVGGGGSGGGVFANTRRNAIGDWLLTFLSRAHPEPHLQEPSGEGSSFTAATATRSTGGGAISGHVSGSENFQALSPAVRPPPLPGGTGGGGGGAGEQQQQQQQHHVHLPNTVVSEPNSPNSPTGPSASSPFSSANLHKRAAMGTQVFERSDVTIPTDTATETEAPGGDTSSGSVHAILATSVNIHGGAPAAQRESSSMDGSGSVVRGALSHQQQNQHRPPAASGSSSTFSQRQTPQEPSQLIGGVGGSLGVGGGGSSVRQHRYGVDAISLLYQLLSKGSNVLPITGGFDAFFETLASVADPDKNNNSFGSGKIVNSVLEASTERMKLTPSVLPAATLAASVSGGGGSGGGDAAADGAAAAASGGGGGGGGATLSTSRTLFVAENDLYLFAKQYFDAVFESMDLLGLNSFTVQHEIEQA